MSDLDRNLDEKSVGGKPTVISWNFAYVGMDKYKRVELRLIMVYLGSTLNLFKKITYLKI